MSEIKVNSVKGVGASSAAITVDNSSGSATANLTTVNSVTMPNGGFLSNRNLVINGAMQVAQRGTSSTTNGYASLDRFRNVYNNTDANVTQSQVDVASGTTPYTLGFRKALKITNGNQTSGDNGDTNIQIWQRVESQNIANSGWNYLSASSFVTLQFWVKSSVAQNFQCYLLNEDTTQNTFPFETGSLSADTWTKVTKTIAGNSNLTFNNDNGAGLRIAICPFLGSNKTANSLSLDTWATFDGNNFARDCTTTWLTTNAATFELTGVQLEVGSVSTDFEHKTIGDDLALCQRYFERNIMYLSTNDNMGNNYMVEKRAAATVTSPDAGGTFALSGVTPSVTSFWAKRTGGGGEFTVHIDAEL